MRCVWSGRALSAGRIEIDHCLPWSALPCGDLWNLMPSDRSVNQNQKRERLPSGPALAKAKPLALEWWRRSWQADPGLSRRFGQEINAALPVADAPSLDEVFTALE